MNSRQAILMLAGLGHEIRLALVEMLVEAGPPGLPAGTIAARLGHAPSSLSFHLQQLTQAGLLCQRRSSRQIIYSANLEAMNDLLSLLGEKFGARNWSEAARAPAQQAEKFAAVGSITRTRN